MRLTVLNVGYPLAPVSSGTAGGAEQILAMLDEALVSAGHHSLVIAPSGSKCKGLLLPVPPVNSVLDENAIRRARLHQRDAIERALKHFPVDVVHLHGVDFPEYLPECHIPIVVTLHLPLDWYAEKIFRWQQHNLYFVGVSQTQALSRPVFACTGKIISNGIPVDQFRPGKKMGAYGLCIGRICPEKGFHLALDACTDCGLPLMIAGKVFPYPEHAAYFDNEIRPRLKGSRNRFLGQVGGIRKRHLLAGAACVIVPSLVDETSSLVAMEAMACGTPVVAFRRGALSEIIAHGRTGILVDDPYDLAGAVHKACALKGAACRTEAERRFSGRRMTSEYLDLYQSVVSDCQSSKRPRETILFSKQHIPASAASDFSSNGARHCA